jgi:hypothetical protein
MLQNEAGTQPAQLGQLLVVIDTTTQQVGDLRLKRGARRYSLHLA